MREARERGVNTSLVVEPTGTGKSQIAIEDIDQLYREGKIERVLVMVPSTMIKADWDTVLYIVSLFKEHFKCYVSLRRITMLPQGF